MQRMMDRLLELGQELLRQRTPNTALQSHLNASPAGGTPRQQGSQADTKGLEKPDALGGTALKWRDWKVVTSSCAVACHEVLAGLMTKAEETGDPVFNATFVNNEAREASTKRAFILVRIC